MVGVKIGVGWIGWCVLIGLLVVVGVYLDLFFVGVLYVVKFDFIVDGEGYWIVNFVYDMCVMMVMLCVIYLLIKCMVVYV